MRHFDLVIVGGGMAGLTFLSAIKPAIDQGLSVMLIDPAPAPELDQPGSPSFDDRATALSEQTLQIFKDLNIKQLDQIGSDISEIEISDHGHLGYHKMSSAKLKLPRFGAVIANKSLGATLWQQVKNLPIDWAFQTEVTTMSPTQVGHSLVLSNKDLISCTQVVLCDGNRSSLASKAGLATKTHEFNAIARIATVRTEQPHNGRAFERFTKSGPIALLPFGEFSALVWTLSNDDSRLLNMNKSQALTWLNSNFGQRLGAITQISDWAQYPLIEAQLQTNLSHGLIALGNAAATLHPVAGQGFNLAIRGIIRIAMLINEHYCNTQVMPGFIHFQQVANSINKDKAKTVSFSHELIKVFGTHSRFVQMGRGIGLNCLDRHPILSKSFALASMGLLESMPAIVNEDFS